MNRMLDMLSTFGFLFVLVCLVASLLFFARPHVVWAIFTRNLKNYFTSVLGYLFIIAFVTVSALLTFSNQFFADNQANLDQLSQYFPILLLFFVPAITMSIWADEIRQGTDAILFTLPASDLEILLGKYLSAIGTYSIALVFSLTQLIALASISSPDWGVLAATYMGYWLAGTSLIAIGMFASSLSGSATVAFILAALFCQIPVLLTQYVGGNFLGQLSIGWHLKDFSLGLISLPSVIYFMAITIFSLYLNLVVITKRHWSGGKKVGMGIHYGIRVVAVLSGLLAFYFMYEGLSSYLQTRLDLTNQRLYTLTRMTEETIQEAEKSERPVTIQAFISTDVPQHYVDLKKHFVGLLRQYDRMSPSVHVELIEVEPNSSEEKQAKTLGIEPRTDRTEIDGRSVEQEIYMGAYISSTLGDVVLPFVDSDAIEYELTHSLAATTDQKKKIVVGVLATDARFTGVRVRELDQEVLIHPWFYTKIQRELKKHYELVDLSVGDLAEMVFRKSPGYKKPAPVPGQKIDEKRETLMTNGPDVLLVAAPSSLSSLGMNQLSEYIQLGRPVMIMADPLPIHPFTTLQPEQIGVINAPMQQRFNARSPWAVFSSEFDPARMQRFPFLPPKADNGTAKTLLDTLGIQWNHGDTVWSNQRPPSSFEPKWQKTISERWPDHFGPRDNFFVFANRDGNTNPFAEDDMISQSLNGMLFFYPGAISKMPGSKTNFQPLVTFGKDSGRFTWNQLIENMYEEQPVYGPSGPVIDMVTGKPKTKMEPIVMPQSGVAFARIRKNVDNVVDKTILNADYVKTVQGDRIELKTLSGGVPKDGDRIKIVRGDDEIADVEIESLSYDGDELKQGDLLTVQLSTDAATVRPGDKLEIYRLVTIIFGEPQTIAAHITGDLENDKTMNVVFVADCDFVTDLYFEQIESLKTKPDNVMFFQNCIESLADKTDFVALRSRRPRPRTLTGVERRVAAFRNSRFKKQAQMERDISRKLINMENAVKKADRQMQDSDLGVIQQIQQGLQSRSSEARKFSIAKANLDKQLKEDIDDLKAGERKQAKGLENRIRVFAVVSAPLPAFLLGLVVLFFRVSNENRSVDPSRRRFLIRESNDMNETIKTGLFAGFAILLAAASALVVWGTRPKPNVEFELVGEPFFEEFDVKDAASLTISAIDQETEALVEFTVRREGDTWIIPTHHGYPAEAADRLAQATTSLMGVKRDMLQGRLPKEQKKYGVVSPASYTDPASEDTFQPGETGSRITLKNKDDEVLIDLIVGKPVPAADGSENSGYFYARHPDEDQTYRVEMDLNLSTKFGEWIDPDLLRVSKDEFTKLDLYNYTFKEKAVQYGQQIEIIKEYVPGDEFKLSKTPESNSWEMEGVDVRKENVNQTFVESILALLDDMKIAGVRKKQLLPNQKPLLLPDLTVNIEALKEVASDTSQADMQKLIMNVAQVAKRDLRDQGFYLNEKSSAKKGERLFSEKGMISAVTSSGVRYTVYFGELFLGSTNAVEIGVDEGPSANPQNDPAAELKSVDVKKDPGQLPADTSKNNRNRYVMVRVAFDESGLPPKPDMPKQPVEPKKPDGYLPPDSRQPAKPGENQEPPRPPLSPAKKKAFEAYDSAMLQFESDKAAFGGLKDKFDNDVKIREARIKSGQKRVDELNNRFGIWYYVVPAGQYDSLRIGRERLVQPKPESERPKDLPKVPNIEFPSGTSGKNKAANGNDKKRP